MMRGFFIVLCFALTQPLLAQEEMPVVVFSGQDVSLDNALLQLRKGYGIAMVYDGRALRGYSVSGAGTEQRLDELLKQWLEPIGFAFEYINDTYVIFADASVAKPKEPVTFGIKLNGRVVDRASKEPLPFANVAIAGSRRGAAANEQGYFVLGDVPADTSAIQVTFLGYEARTIRVSELDEEQAVIELDRLSAILPLALIRGDRQPGIIQTRGLSVTTIDPEMAVYLPGVGEPDPIRTLQLLPGVSGALENSANLHIRGGAADENLVLYDGFTIYYLDHFYGVFSAFNTNAIKNIRLHKGVVEPAFGGRASSVIEITGKQGDLNQTRVKTDVSLLSAALHLESPILGNRASMVISGRRAYTDILYSSLYRQIFNNFYANSTLGDRAVNEGVFGSEQAPDFSFYDLTAKVGWETEDNDRFSFTVYSGRDRLAMQFAERTRDDRFFYEYNDQSAWGNTGVGARWAKQWDATSSSTLTFGYSSYRSELFGFDSRTNLFIGVIDTLFFDRNSEISDLSMRYDHQLIRGDHTLKFGTANTAMRVENSRLDSDGDAARSIAAESTLAVYLQDQWQITPNWLLYGGSRLTWYTGTNTLYHEPRIITSYQINRNWSLQGAAGRNWQFIRNIRRQDLFLNTSDEWRLAGEGSVPLLAVNQFSFGGTLQLNHFTLEAEAFHKQSEGAIEDALRFISEDPGTFTDDLLTGSGRASGVEFLVSKPKGLHTGWVAYTLSRATHRFDALDNTAIPAYYDRLHEAKAVYVYNPGRYRLSAVFVYASGLPYTAVDGITDVALPTGETRPIVAFSDLNGARLPDYHRLDLSANYVFNWLSGKTMVGVSLYNVYGRTNVRNRYFFSSGSQSDALLVDFNDLIFLGFVPSLQLSFEW